MKQAAALRTATLIAGKFVLCCIVTIFYRTNLHSTQGRMWMEGAAWQWTVLCTYRRQTAVQSLSGIWRRRVRQQTQEIQENSTPTGQLQKGALCKHEAIAGFDREKQMMTGDVWLCFNKTTLFTHSKLSWLPASDFISLAWHRGRRSQRQWVVPWRYISTLWAIQRHDNVTSQRHTSAHYGPFSAMTTWIVRE